MITVPVFEYPRTFYGGAVSAVNVGTFALSASGYKAGVVFRVPKAGNIHKIGFKLGTITTATDTDFRVETVSAQFPTGTLQATNTNGSIASGSLTANVMNMATLTADATVAANDLIAIVIAPSGSPNFQVSTIGPGSGNQIPYGVQYAGSWAVASFNNPFMVAVEYSDGTYAQIPSIYPLTTLTTHTFNSGSTPDEIGAAFQVPFACRVGGFWVSVDLDNTFDMVLYDSDGVTALATATLTSDGRLSTANVAAAYGYFPSAQTLKANTTYYLSVKPGASSVSIYSWTVLSAAAMDQMPGGQQWKYTSAKNPTGTGSWTNVDTQYPVMGLLIDGVSEAGIHLVGAGGLVG